MRFVSKRTRSPRSLFSVEREIDIYLVLLNKLTKIVFFN